MKRVVSLFGSYSLTLCLVAITAFAALGAWEHYNKLPWTRDGRVSANVVRVGADVSGMISAVFVVDNQYVHQGDVLYKIDPERFRLAVASAKAAVEAKRQDMIVLEAIARRRRLIPEAVSREKIQQVTGNAKVAAASYQRALADLGLAKLNLARTIIRSPVDGYVSNLILRPGDFATAGVTKISVLDMASFWVIGYFEETKIRQIHIGSTARIRLMGFDQPLAGHVESIGRGIENSNTTPGLLGLPNVEPTFSWVRLAQRIPVHISIDNKPPSVELVAGMTATVEINTVSTKPERSQERQWSMASLPDWIHDFAHGAMSLIQ